MYTIVRFSWQGCEHNHLPSFFFTLGFCIYLSYSLLPPLYALTLQFIHSFLFETFPSKVPPSAFLTLKSLSVFWSVNCHPHFRLSPFPHADLAFPGYLCTQLLCLILSLSLSLFQLPSFQIKFPRLSSFWIIYNYTLFPSYSSLLAVFDLHSLFLILYSSFFCLLVSLLITYYPAPPPLRVL